MSYNITNMRVKELKMTITPEQLKTVVDEWHQLEITTDLKRWRLNRNGEGLTMSGRVIDKNYEVEEINCSGTASGTQWCEMVEPLLKETKATLNAQLVWEGGDCIERVLVLDGGIRRWEVE